MVRGKFSIGMLQVGYTVRVLEGRGRIVDLWRDCNQWYVDLLMDHNSGIKSIPFSHLVSIIGMMGKPIRICSDN